MDRKITLLTTPYSSHYSHIGGSPLETLENVANIELPNPVKTQEQGGFQSVWNDGTQLTSYDEVLGESDALIVAPWLLPPPFTPERWRNAKNLRVIAGTFDNRFEEWLDLDEARQRNVTVIDTSRSMTPSVAEFALAMTLNLLRDIPAAVQLVREGNWKDTYGWDQHGFVYGDLSERKVGLAGFGSINRRYSELLAPFNCDTWSYDPYVPEGVFSAAGITSAETLIELASRSDVFVVGIPPTPSTQGIIDRAVIEALPRGAAVVLVTRMAVVDQEALWARVNRGELRVAVDVFDPEPPSKDAWIRINAQILPTPHIAGDAALYHRRCFTSACADTIATLNGAPARYVTSARDGQIYRGDTKNLKAE